LAKGWDQGASARRMAAALLKGIHERVRLVVVPEAKWVSKAKVRHWPPRHRILSVQ
jgi:hypothetical protein